MPKSQTEMLHEDPSYIALKRFDYSITNLLDRYPSSCPDHVIAAALLISESDVEIEYQRIVLKLRGLMGVSI